jgi:hypothetical protein
MNVFFCDVCGVRVTDVDLKSGHGMRQRHDVICATCLEMGHGKGWAEKAGLSARSAVVITDKTPRPADPAARLDVPRDRAATIDNSAPVPASASVPTPAPVPAAPETAGDLDGLAASFAAMSVTPERPGQVDEPSDSAPAPQGGKADTEPGIEVDELPAASGRRSTSGRLKSPSSKVGSPGSARTPKPSGGKAADSERRATAPSSANTPVVNPTAVETCVDSSKKATSSTKRTKVTKSVRKPGGIPRVVLVTIAGVLLIVVAGLGIMATMGVFSGSKQARVFDPKEARDRLTEAHKEAKVASFKDPHEATDAQVEEAISKIRDMQAAMSQFEKAVSGQWSESQLGTHLSNLGYADVMGKMKMWNDEKAKRGQRMK